MIVKGQRPTHRQRQAEATKEQVGSAARVLFRRNGYVATTMAAIADAADIPLPTIYSAMGSKAKILEDVAWRVAATMDIDAQHERARQHPDPTNGLRMAAKIQRRQYEEMYDVISAYQEAARTEPDLARSMSLIERNRENAFRRHIQAIRPHLRPGLDEDSAVDAYIVLAQPETYRTLVVDRGWPPDRYQEWFATHLINDLLGATVPPEQLQ